MRSTLLLLAVVAPACASPSFETVADVAALCADRTPEPIAFDVFFDDAEGCAWGDDGNLDAEQGIYAARERESKLVEELTDAVLCSLEFDVNGDFEYEDDFFFVSNDAVLLSNRGAVVGEFSEWERYPLFDWEDIVELDIPGSSQFTPFCAGEDEGDADCEVPRQRQNGSWEGDLEYEPAPIIAHELSFRAQSLGQLEFGLITTGDNDDEDCGHSELDLEITGTGVLL